MLVVWGRMSSMNVQKVAWSCEELGIPYLQRDAGREFGIVDEPGYRRLNPNGRVPTIEDDGFVLWESNAIVRYLARKVPGGNLLPPDSRGLARAEQWMDWQIAVLWLPMRDLLLSHLRTSPERRDAEADEAARVRASKAFEILDAQLGSSRYVAGDRFTMADIALGVWVWRWMALPIERPELVQLRRWFDLLAERPAYRNIVMQPLT